MTLALRLALALVLLGGCAPAVVPADRADVFRRVLPSTVQLRAEREGGGRRAGSGVVIASDPRGNRSWILTTRHFLEPSVAQQVWANVPGRRGRLSGEVVAVGTDVDLALVRLDGLVLPPVALRDQVQLGDEVWVVGFPWGRRLTVVSGIVSQIAADEGEVAISGPPRMVDASVSYGSSGGGVFEAASGALVGIVEGYRTARLTMPTTPERTLDVPVPGETTVIPAQAIRRFLSGVGLPGLPAPEP